MSGDVDIHPMPWISRYAMNQSRKRTQAFRVEMSGAGEAIDEEVLIQGWRRRNGHELSHLETVTDQQRGLFFEDERRDINEQVSKRFLVVALVAGVSAICIGLFLIWTFVGNGWMTDAMTVLWNLMTRWTTP